MPNLQVFDPPMCCSTGICGPSVDPKLVRFAADLEWLKSKGIHVERYNLAQDTGAFTHNATVKKELNAHGTKCLPLLIMDGQQIIATGIYPARKVLAECLGVDYEPGPVVKQRPDLVGIAPSKHK